VTGAGAGPAAAGGRVSVTRRITATAREIFAVIADPANHPGLDGSGMLRPGGPAAEVISRAGDTFSVRMFQPHIGDYVMLNRVLDYVADRRLVWEPTPGDAAAVATARLPVGAPQGYIWGFELTPDGPDATLVTEFFDCTAAVDAIRTAVDDGRAWLDAMSQTLARLAAAAEQARPGPAAG
jgi:hypothetical protein